MSTSKTILDPLKALVLKSSSIHHKALAEIPMPNDLALVRKQHMTVSVGMLPSYVRQPRVLYRFKRNGWSGFTVDYNLTVQS